MENKLRRGLALLMTLIMLISCAPMDALAAIVPVSGGTQTSDGFTLKSIVKPPVATHTYIFKNGDTEFARQIVKDGESLNNPGTPDAGSPNREFTGWRDGDNNAPVFGEVTVTETKTTTYHAQFADVYFVFFTNPDGEVMVTKKGANGEKISTDGVTYPVGNEQSIIGWNYTGNEDDPLISEVKLEGKDVTLKAVVKDGHWITYDSQGGTYVEPAFVKANEGTTAPTNPTRPGYTFAHWSETKGGAAFTFGQRLDKSPTLYAVWTPNTRTQYTVIHWQENADDDDYSFAESEPQYGTTGAQTSAAAKSYTGFTAQTIAQQTIAGDGSTIVNVYYKRNTYTITFYLDDPIYNCGKEEHTHSRRNGCYDWRGNLICTKEEHTHNSACDKITQITINAKYDANISDQWPTVNGSSTWRTSQNGTTYQVNIDTMPLNGAKFYGPKTDSSSESAHYYVEVLPGETGETVSGRTYKLHHTDTSPGTGYTVSVEDQYPITGFTFNEDISTKIKGKYNNAKFYYTRNSYNIVYVSGGQTVHTVSKKYEQSIADEGSYTPTTKPEGKEAYEFGGWYSDPTTTQAYSFTGKTMPAQNVTVYAKWNLPIVNGKAHIKVDGTDEGTTLTATYGEALNAEELNTLQNAIMDDHPGYTWRGWRTGPNGTGDPFNVDTKIYNNITLYPYYTKDGTFTVEYVSGKNDVTAPVDTKAYAEDSFADLKSPGKLVAADGQYFLGWKDSTGTIYQPRDKYQIKSIHANKENVITLTAQWGARPAGTTLTYKANGGAGEDVVENLANNATVTTIANPFSRVGYTFKGWDTDPKGEGSIAPNTQVQVDNNDGANVLYAIWTANTDTKYTVEFYYQNVDGTYTLNHSDKRTATTDTTVSVTDADKAAKENNKYVFEADNKNNVLSGNVAGDGSLVLKLYFKLNTASYTIHHYLNGTTVKVADDETGTKTIGETLTANKSGALYAAYAAAVVAGYDPSQTITINATGNVITVYYTVPLTITAENADKKYDGQPLTQPDFTVEGLVNGDTKDSFSLSMTAASTITNAGNTPNVIDTDTVKYNGGAIPSYYNVSYKPGTLTVNKASATVTITGVNETHVYDGRQHEANGYNYSFTGKPGQITISLKPNVLAIARRTDVGTTTMGLTKDSFTVTSANYDVTIKAVNDGYVTITPVTDKVTVTVTENGAIVTYDGNEHSVKGYKSMTADNKLYDVTTSVKATETAAWTAKGKDAGDYLVGIVAGDFENTNTNFTNVEFVIVDGVLKINPITENKITITANSASKTYDGTPLTDNGFTFTQGVLADGDVLTAVVEGSATNVGDEGKNVVKSYAVMRDGADVTGNYTFTDSVDGTLTINKRTVTLKSETASKEYDGTPLTKPDVTVGGDGFVAGEVIGITATGSVTFVHEGKVTNAITFTTGEKFNEDNYTITKNEGKLSITKREGEGKTITVTANSGEKVYDGAPLTNNGHTHAGALVEGDVLTAVVEGSQTDVGVGDNVVTSYKVMRGKTDVTTSYTFTDSVKGALTVTLRDVTFTGESKSLPYTGGMQSITGITQSGLVEGHKYEGLTYKAEGQNVGSYDGAFSGDVVIKDAQGNDVTKNYNVTKTPGKLTITNASFTVTFTGESAEKVYNGSEQSITGITVTGLKTGHRYENLTYEAKGTDKGEYVGAFTGTVKILDENNVDVTENYAVTQTPGKLTITAYTTEVVVTISGGTDTVTYDGNEHSVNGYEIDSIQIDGKDSTLYTVNDFEFTGTAKATGTNADKYEMGLKESDFQNISDNFTNVKFVVNDGELVINKRPVKVTAERLEYAYDYENPVAHPADDVARYTVEAADGDRGLLAGDALNADVLYDGQSTQTLIGVYQAVAQIAAAKITNANGDVTDNYTIEKVDRTLTITGNDPLDPGKETTSVQTNYTVGDVIEYKITVKNVSRDEATNVVVTDSMAEIQDNADYTVSNDRHTATIASIPAGGTVLVYARHTVTAEDVEKAYAGDANGSLTNVANIKFGDWSKDVEGDHDKLNDTYEYVVRYYWNNYTSVQPHEEKKLTAKVGNEVTEEPAVIEGYTPVSADSKKLIISADQSKNVIEFYYYKNVELTANSETYTYDGTEKSVSGFTKDGENTDAAGATIPADFSAIAVGAKGTDANEYPANFAENTVGMADKTGRYIVTAANNGKLVINPVTGQLITITANSASKTYDGTPLTDNGFTFTQGVLADGDVLTAVVEGSATNVGDEGKNVVKSYVVKRGETDVTKNYTFTDSVDGKLTINPRPVTLTSETASKEYDGTPLTKPNVTVTGDGFVAGEVTGITATGSVTFVDDGEVPNAITYTEGANYKESNYTITKNEGKLTITQRTDIIVITTPTRSRAYNGKKLLDYQCTYTGTIADGDELIMTFPEDDGLINAGSKPNQYERYRVERKSDGRDVTNNYTFGESIIGTLTVTPVAIELTAASDSKQYDGTPLTKNDYKITNGAFVGEEGLASVTVVGSQTLVGSSANTITAHSLKANTLAQNYTITYQPGELKVTQNEKAITVTANSHTWEYDGQPHSDGGYTVEYDGQTYKVEAGKTATLPTGDVVKAKITKTVTNVSDSVAGNNTIDELTIVNAAGEDTKGQYKTVTLIPGTLTITKRGAGEEKVKITAADNTVEYDGQPHGAKLNAAGQIEIGTSFTVTNLAEGHSVKTLAIEGSETDAGVYADKLVPGNAVIVDGNGVEVTANYDITYVPGTLTITRRGAGDMKVVLTAANNTVVYDGQPHGAKLNDKGEIEVGTSYTITNLADGHKVQSVVISGSETAVGEYENKLVPSDAKIVDAAGNDVTKNYVVDYKNGKLTITSPDTVTVTIKGKTDTVEYNGQKHEVNGYEVVSISNTLYTEADFGFADGAAAHAEGTDAGEYPMNLTKDSFVNKNGNFTSVTFVVEDGKLTITRRGLDEKNLVKIIAAKNTVYYDGQPHGAKLNAADQIEVGTSYTTEYLAPGHKVQTVAIDGSETMVGVYEGRLVPKSAVIVDENDNDVTRNYEITYVPGTLEIKKNETEIKVTANSHTWEYDGQPHSDGGYTVNYDGVDYPVEAGEFATLPTGDVVKAKITKTVTNVSDSVADNNTIDELTIVNAAGEDTKGQYKTISLIPGTLTITKRGAGENKVTIKANDNLGVVYDGQAHGENGHTDTNLAEGHHVETVTIDGSRINVGTYKEELVPHDAKIVDTDGNDVTDNYEITYKEGDLEIVSPDTVVVTIRGNKETVEYDGTKHEVNGYEVVSISNALYTENDFGFAEGAAAHAEGVDADTYPMNLTSESFVNKSTNFATVSFIVEDGALTITKRGAGENKVTITARDNTVNYDGQPHGAKLNAAGQIEVNVSYTTEYLAPGHKVQSVAIDGSETMVGVYEGRLVPNAAIIVDENDNDVTRNYVITYVSGTLEIKKNETEIKVTANSHTWEYDGQPHSDGGYTVTYGEESYTVKADDSATLSTGDKVTAVITRKVKNVSDTADGNNEIVTLTVENESQYASIIQEAGTLTITRRPVKVTINSKINSESFTYDAAEHTVADEHGKEYTIETAAENSGLLPGHTESLNVVYDDGTTKTESRKYVGTYTADSERDENGEAVVTITKADSGEDVTANYAITVKPGTLEIAKAEIEIELIGPKSERVYNGQEQVVETTEITTDEAYAHGAEEPKTIKIVAKGLKGEDYISEGTVIHIAKGTYVGEHTGNFVWDGPHGNDEKPTVLNNDGNGNAVDVTENYTFKRTPGSLTITSDHPTQPDKEIDGHEPGTKYALGDRIYFKITVRNITLESLELVEVHDPTAVIVDGDGYTVVDEHHAKIENMPASVDGQEPATVVINAYHVVTEDDIKNIVIDSGYKYENVATITVGDKTIDARKGTNDIEDADYTLKIEKQLINRPASGEKFKLGETAKFQITVTNEGNVTQTDIPVAEKLPGAVFTEGDGYTLNADKTVATITKVLNPADKESQRGDSIVLYAQYTIKEEDLGNKNLKNIVTAPNGKPGEEPIPVDEAKSMAGQKIWNDLDNLYDTRTESVTVNLKRKAGQNGAAEQYKTATVDQSTGWRYGFDHLPAHDMQNNEFFYWVEEAPITGYEPTYEVKDDSHCDIVNNLQTYTLTIHYWQHKLGDTKMEQAFPDYVATLYYKQPYDVESPEREGIILDDMSQARISGTMPAHDLVIDVYYHRIAYRLTIHYIYQDGTMAHEDYTWTYWFNSTYNVPSPIIPGFTPSIDVIAGRMPSHGLELTVVYVGDGEIVVPDEDTSLGFKSYLNAGECFE